MKSAFALAALASAALSFPAFAQSLTGNVGSAGITRGEEGVEFRIGLDDDGNAAARAHYDYAFTDWYQLRTIASLSQDDGDDWRFSGLTVSNWFQWREEADDNTGFNGGFRLDYTFDEEGEDELEARLTFTDKFGDGWEWRGNLIGEVEAREGFAEGVELEARLQTTRAIPVSALGSQDWRLGAELFSELGNSEDIPKLDDQAHQIGPVMKAEWENGVYLQSAVRFGLTDASDDGMVKLFVGREF